MEKKTNYDKGFSDGWVASQAATLILMGVIYFFTH